MWDVELKMTLWVSYDAFIVDVAFAHHFVAPYHLPPYRGACGIGYASKN